MPLINDFLKIRILMDEFLPFKEQTLKQKPADRHAKRRTNKYLFHSLWFGPTGDRTHDLAHSQRAH
jgi:hypothetical protein